MQVLIICLRFTLTLRDETKFGELFEAIGAWKLFRPSSIVRHEKHCRMWKVVAFTEQARSGLPTVMRERAY